MLFSNPFFLVMVFIGLITLAVHSYMDGAEMPIRNYNFGQAVIAVLFNIVLVAGAIMWAVNKY